MTVVFGDFVFKISAPVKNAIDNLNRWDKASERVTKNQKTSADEEEEAMKKRQKSWKGFFNTAKLAFASLTAMVMKWSPHVNAHLTMIGLSMKLLAMDIGKTWAPAFKLASNLLRGFVMWWKEMGKGSVKMPEVEKGEQAEGVFGQLGLTKGQLADIKKAIHEITNWLLLLGGALATVAIIAKVAGMVFGGLGLTGIFTALAPIVTTLGGAILGALGPIALILLIVGALLAGFASAWEENLWNIQGHVDTFFLGVQNIFEGLFKFLGGIFGAIWGLITGDTDKFLSGLGTAFDGLVQFVLGVGQAIVSFFVILIISAFKFGYNIGTVIGDLVKIGLEMFGNLWAEIVKIWDGIWATIFEVANDIGETVEEMVGGLVQNFIDFALDAPANIQKGIDEIVKSFSSLISDSLKWGGDLISNFWKGISNMGGWLYDNIAGFFYDNVTSKFGFDIKANDDMAKRWGSDMIDNFAQGVKTGGQTVVNQRVLQNLTINNSVSREGLDVYGLANFTRSALDESIKETKGIGSQYY